jgi:hypothetical protein
MLTKPASQKILKGIIHIEEKEKQSQIWEVRKEHSKESKKASSMINSVRLMPKVKNNQYDIQPVKKQ